jgi:energy-coupling factor transporter ATP-binding protein EcfA2
MMAETAFKFLLREGDRPFRSSRCFVIADPASRDRAQWTLQLDPPVNAAWTFEINDVKDWMLHGPPVRQIIQDPANARTSNFRILDRDAIFRAYLRQVRDNIPEAYRSRRIVALMPSIADHAARTRYKDAIEAAIPGAAVMPEPEMVAEYFRLLMRRLELEAGRNNVILVIDVGAATANMTLIVSRRDRKIVDVGTTGTQRDLRLRALRGDSRGRAGRWVDQKLAGLLGVDPEEPTILREVEALKVRASAQPDKEHVAVAANGVRMAIDGALLADVAGELWGELLPLFRQLSGRLYENQTASESARELSRERFDELGVTSALEAHRLIDTVLLAGGTSLLPGFEKAMLSTLFQDGHRPAVLRVGDAFAIAAASGGVAHILHNYEPPRLREASGRSAAVFAAPLEATLQHPLLLGIKLPNEREQLVVLLEPDDPFIDDGGVRSVEGVPALAAKSQPRMRLLPSLASGREARRGRQFEPMRVIRAPGRMDLQWDPRRERATIRSDEVEGTGKLWIDAHLLRTRQEAAPNPFVDSLPANLLAVDAAEEVVLDIGMSKIVAVTADRGAISAEMLDQLTHQGPPAFPSRTPAPPGEANNFVDGPGIVSSERRSDTPASPPPRPVAPARGGWGARVADADVVGALVRARDALADSAPHLRFDDIVVALLALAARPVVLLAGPPGCGKSTLVRLIASLLGMQSGDRFHEVAVQAHWADDDGLFGENGALTPLLTEVEGAHLILFDEFNLTRPEYYLSRLFHALDTETGLISPSQRLASCRVFGTLNIDESSRPPSPKVIDRCFLMELEPVDWDNAAAAAAAPVLPPDFAGLPGLPAVAADAAGGDPRIDTVLRALHRAVDDHDLRPDLLPSRRVLADIKALLSLHERLGLERDGLLDRSDLVDRLLASRVLVKLSGAFDQVGFALDALEKAVDGIDELHRTRRRLKLARQQARLGFVSPWQ